MQSMSVAHTVLQAVGPQTYWSQLWAAGMEQLPAPSQKAAGVWLPPLQDGSPHMVVGGALAQV